MVRLIKRVVALAIFAYAVALLWTAVSMARYADPAPIPQVSAIVVLSGASTEDNEPKGETRIRVDRGVELWQAGRAPVLVMSGGGQRALDGPGDAVFMANHAASLGVPEGVILLEPASHSTLQNAWNTARLETIDPDEPILLVTHRFHLSRAVASFRWAGFSNITAIAADPEGTNEITPGLLLEGVKWPANILRAAGATAALAFDVSETDVYPWLN